MINNEARRKELFVRFMQKYGHAIFKAQDEAASANLLFCPLTGVPGFATENFIVFKEALHGEKFVNDVEVHAQV